MGHIAGVLHTVDVQDIDVVGQDIPLKVDQTAGRSILDQLDQGLALQDIDVQIQVLLAGAIIVEQQLGNTAVCIHRQGVVIVFAALGDLGALVCHRNIRTAGLVCSQQRVEVVVDGHVGIAHHHIALLLVLQEAQDGSQSLHAAGVDAHALFCKRRHDVQTAVAAGHIPLTAGAQVIHQGVIVFAHHDGNIGDAAVCHAGQHKVHHAVTACKRDRSHGTLGDQLRNGIIIAVGENDAQCIGVLAQHTSSPSLTASNTLAPSLTVAPAPMDRPVPT